MPHSSSLLPQRDSLELASLASLTSEEQIEGRHSIESSSTSGPPSSRKLSFSDPEASSRGGNHVPPTRRSYSVSSAFDFNGSLFPLSSSGAAAGYTAIGTPMTPHFDHAGGGPQQNLEKHKSLTYLNGLSLMIGLIVGSGIFSSPASVNSNVGSPAAGLLVWVISGILAWTGAASYAELGGAIPLNGGAQVYLSKIYGEWAGFLFAWCSVVVLRPGSTAIIAVIFGEYLVQAVTGAGPTDVSPWVNKAVALAGLIAVTAMNCISTKLGTRGADFFLFFKFIGLVAITVTGIVVGATGLAYHKEDLSTAWRTQSWFEGTSMSSSEWAVALYAGLWAYDGWDNVNYVVGEMLRPGRDLPRTIHTSLPLVILAYIVANLSYIFVLPLETINHSNTVAVAFGNTVFGPVGSLVFALLVCGSCFGALNATTFTGGRLVYSAAKEGYVPSFFGSLGFSATDAQAAYAPRRSSRTGRLRRLLGDEQGFFYTPVYAMLLNLAVTTIYTIIGDFTTLTTFYGVAGYLGYFSVVIGLIILRVREPELERPYKCWITTPIIFCCVSLFLLSRLIFAKPLQSLIVVAFIVAGVPLYWWRIGSKHPRSGSKGRSSSERWWKFWRRWGRS